MTDKDLKSFFLKALAPLHDAVARDVATKPDDAMDSYLLPVLGKENIVKGTSVSESLLLLWAGDDRAELRKLVPDIARLVKELRASEESSGEVSSLIYPMY